MRRSEAFSLAIEDSICPPSKSVEEKSKPFEVVEFSRELAFN
jgi:hypothetical protein